MKVTLSDLDQIDALVDEMVREREKLGSVSYRTALLVLATEHPDLFQARARLRSGRTKEEEIIAYRVNGKIVRVAEPGTNRQQDLQVAMREAAEIGATKSRGR